MGPRTASKACPHSPGACSRDCSWASPDGGISAWRYRSCLYLAQRSDLELILVVADGAGDEAGGIRWPVKRADRPQPHRIDAVLVDDQRTKLRVAILLDHIDEVVVGDEACDAGMEREGADPQAIELLSARLQKLDRFIHRGRSRAEIDHAVFGGLGGVGRQR